MLAGELIAGVKKIRMPGTRRWQQTLTPCKYPQQINGNQPKIYIK